jgi:hypothetical protein
MVSLWKFSVSNKFPSIFDTRLQHALSQHALYVGFAVLIFIQSVNSRPVPTGNYRLYHKEVTHFLTTSLRNNNWQQIFSKCQEFINRHAQLLFVLYTVTRFFCLISRVALFISLPLFLLPYYILSLFSSYFFFFPKST